MRQPKTKRKENYVLYKAKSKAKQLRGAVFEEAQKLGLPNEDIKSAIMDMLKKAKENHD